jgi:hypothetical protein
MSNESSAAQTPIVTVLFTEGENGVLDKPERRAVTKCCEVCGVTEEDVRAFEILVSPQGVAHFSDEDGTGDTKCGKDATRDAWWWPL